ETDLLGHADAEGGAAARLHPGGVDQPQSHGPSRRSKDFFDFSGANRLHFRSNLILEPTPGPTRQASHRRGPPMLRPRPRGLVAWAWRGRAAGAPAARAQVTPYTIRDLGSLAGATGISQARGISSDGRYVTGFTAVAGGGLQAFRYDTISNSM